MYHDEDEGGMWTVEEERESALAQDAMTQGQYMTAAVRQYADVYGEGREDVEYILSPYDTWEKNPHYRGKPGRHPEDYGMDDEPEVITERKLPRPLPPLDEDDIPF